MGKFLTQDEFVKRSRESHGDKYDYSLVEYNNSHVLVKIICKEHGIFEQMPYSHLNGNGCSKCVGLKKLTTEEFIEKSKKVHGNKYDYSNVRYINNSIPVEIKCEIHGIFNQVPEYHMRGSNCPICAGMLKKTTNEFVEKSKIIHGDLYDYSKVDYVSAHKKVIIICDKHGEFQQTPNSHYKRNGCPICKKSKGEKTIERFLTEHLIFFKPQKRFDDCKNINYLFFDFYLPDYKACIEFDGEQHFTKYRFEDNDDKFKIRKKRDEIKTNFCAKNDIKLIRINYKENIEEKLQWILKIVN